MLLVEGQETSHPGHPLPLGGGPEDTRSLLLCGGLEECRLGLPPLVGGGLGDILFAFSVLPLSSQMSCISIYNIIYKSLPFFLRQRLCPQYSTQYLTCCRHSITLKNEWMVVFDIMQRRLTTGSHCRLLNRVMK